MQRLSQFQNVTLTVRTGGSPSSGREKDGPVSPYESSKVVERVVKKENPLVVMEKQRINMKYLSKLTR